MSPATPSRPSRTVMMLYGSGDFGLALTGAMVAWLYGIFLVDVVGLRASHAAAAIFLGRTWDYLNDPFVGWLSDRTRTRWGRRRPFLLFGALPFALTFAMMWWRPPIGVGFSLAVYYAVAYVLFDTAVTFVATPYYSLTPELSDDYDDRTTLTSARMVFSIVGSLVAFTLPMVFIRSMRPEHSSRIFWTALVFGLVASLPLFVVFAATRERADRMQSAADEKRPSLRSVFSNRPFVFAAVIFLLTWTAVDLVQATLLFYLKYRMGLESRADVISATIFVVALLSIPFWNSASRRMDKRRAFVIGIAFWAAVQIALVYLSPRAGFTVAIILAGLAGIGVGAAHVLPWAMLPDAVEWDEYTTGQRREGMLYSIVTLAQKVAVSIAVPLALAVLEWAGYVANAATQPARVVRSIGWLFGPVPAALLVLAMIAAMRNPLGREEYAKLVEALAARRGQSASGVRDHGAVL